MKIKYIFIACIFILAIFGTWKLTRNYYVSNMENIEQNLQAASDSLEIFRLKNGDLLYEKSIYILNEKEYEKELSLSKNTINELKRKLGSAIQYIAEIEGSIKIDTVWQVKDSIINQTNHFKFHDQYLNIEGYHTNDCTTLTNIHIPVPLNIGFTNNKFFVTSSNPYINITDITGIKSPPKKTIISHGLMVGIGVQYGIINKKFDLGPYFGYGLVLNF